VDGDFDYQFQPRDGGTFFYHCHKNTVLHFEMGLYGLLIVDPKEPEGSLIKAPYRDGGPGFVDAFSPETNHVVPYDVEAFWATDEIDSRWHTLGHNAFMQKCDPDDPINPLNFTRDGFLHDFRADIFTITGIARRFDDPTPFTALDHPVFGPLVAPTLRVGQTLLVRIGNSQPRNDGRKLPKAHAQPLTVTTILPFCRLDSMYRWASAMASRGKVRSMRGFKTPD
jgi:hypothetical protein